jgi:LysR family cyn operon transcriptional activator
MDLRHLRSFVAVTDAGGISKAAALLRITQPALSRTIRDLEIQIGFDLFDRIGRKLEITANGVDFLQRSRDLLAGVDALADRARSLREGEGGILRVGATPQMLESVLADFIDRHRRAHPTTEIRVVEAGGLELLEKIDRGEVHLALSVAREGFESRALFPARLLAVTRRGHRLAGRSRINVADLAGESVLVLKQEFGSRKWFDAACQVAHVRPNVLLESASPHTLVALARAGQGVAVIPSTVHCGRGVHVAPLLAGGRSIGNWLSVVWDPRRFLPAYGTRFVEELAARTRETYPGKRFERIASFRRRAGSKER